MKSRDLKYLNAGQANLLLLLCCLYAFLICYLCSVLLQGDMEFGILANTNNEAIWRVSE